MKKKYNTQFKVGTRIISQKSPTYFIADVGANHDGNLSRAKKLIRLSKRDWFLYIYRFTILSETNILIKEIAFN